MSSINSDSNSFNFDMQPLATPDENLNPNQPATITGPAHKPIVDTMDSGQGVVTAQTFVSSQAVLDQSNPQQPILVVLTDTINHLKALRDFVDSGFADETIKPQSSTLRDTEKARFTTTGEAVVEDFSLVGNTPVEGRSNNQGDGSPSGGGDQPAATIATSAAQSSSGSDWFKVTGSTTAMINMTSYINSTIRQETELLKLTMAMINIMWDMTLTAAQLQRDIGQKEAQNYYVKAAMAAVSMAVSAATALGTIGAGFAAAKFPMAQTMLQANLLSQIGGIFNSASEMIGNIALGVLAIQKADLEAKLKEEEGRITQIKMLLDQMIQSLEQQHNIIEQFNRYIDQISKQRFSTLAVQGAK